MNNCKEDTYRDFLREMGGRTIAMVKISMEIIRRTVRKQSKRIIRRVVNRRIKMGNRK